MSSGSSTPSKIKVGRLWGYPIIVTIGKSTHEAILLDCNTDDPQQFLNEQIDVKIRWKVAGYNDSVPVSNVELQNVDTLYYLPRKAALAAASAAQGPPAKKRKTIDNTETKSSRVRSSVETDNDEDNEKPAAVPSCINVKEEEGVETDTDDDEEKNPPAVLSSANVKEEEVETDDEELDSAITSGIKTEDIETDNDEEDTKQRACSLKIEEQVETGDEEGGDGEPQAVNKNSGDAFKEETDNEVDLVDLTLADDKEEEEKEVDMVDLTVTDEEDSTELSASSESSPRTAASRRINWAELGLDDSSDEEMGGEKVIAAGDKRKGVDDEQQDKDTDEDGVDTDENDEDSDEEEVYDGEDTDDTEDEQESNEKNKEDMPKIPILTEEEKRVVLIQYRKDHPEVEDSDVETILSEYCKFMYIKIKNCDCTPSPMVADMWVSNCDICSSF